jgi:hypothetical protein
MLVPNRKIEVFMYSDRGVIKTNDKVSFVLLWLGDSHFPPPTCRITQVNDSNIEKALQTKCSFRAYSHASLPPSKTEAI